MSVDDERSTTGIEISDAVWIPRMESDERWVVGAVVINGDGEAFVQRRSLDRTVFPGCWDIVGGHVEPGETIIEALAREVSEETGWILKTVDATLRVYSWTANGRTCLEVDFVVSVDGDLDQPVIEAAKHSEYRWISRNSLAALGENRVSGDDLTLQVVLAALIYSESMQVRRVEGSGA